MNKTTTIPIPNRKYELTEEDRRVLNEHYKLVKKATKRAKKAEKALSMAQFEIARTLCPFTIGDVVYRIEHKRRSYGRVVSFGLRVIEKGLAGNPEDVYYVDVYVSEVNAAGQLRHTKPRTAAWPYFPRNGEENNVRLHEKSNT